MHSRLLTPRTRTLAARPDQTGLRQTYSEPLSLDASSVRDVTSTSRVRAESRNEQPSVEELTFTPSRAPAEEEPQRVRRLAEYWRSQQHSEREHGRSDQSCRHKNGEQPRRPDQTKVKSENNATARAERVPQTTRNARFQDACVAQGVRHDAEIRR